MSYGTRAQAFARAILTVPGSSVLPSENYLRLDFPVRASAADAFTEVLLTDFAAAYSLSLSSPTACPGCERNSTHATFQCLLQPP
jgi:hypothetical protein